jgi:hypothetical protein
MTPKLPKSDVAEIRRLVATIPGIDKRILDLSAVSINRVVVTTGMAVGPLAGGGNIFGVERKEGQWVQVGSIASWTA